MPEIVTLPLDEGIEKGYKRVGLEEIRRWEPPTTWETAVIIGSEVLPAIGLGMAFGYPGMAAGGTAGNWLSQQYRISRGLQEGTSYGELAAATGASLIPGGKLAGFKGLTKAAMRGGQGAVIATGELFARVGLERGEIPTSEEITKTLLFGGGFGLALGGLEARMMRDVLDAPIEKGMTNGEAVSTLKKHIDDVGGVKIYYETANAGLAALLKPLPTPADAARAAENIIDALGDVSARKALQELDVLARTPEAAMTPNQLLSHQFLTSDAPLTKAGLLEQSRLDQGKVINATERARIKELRDLVDSLEHRRTGIPSNEQLEINHALHVAEADLARVNRKLEVNEANLGTDLLNEMRGRVGKAKADEAVARWNARNQPPSKKNKVLEAKRRQMERRVREDLERGEVQVMREPVTAPKTLEVKWGTSKRGGKGRSLVYPVRIGDTNFEITSTIFKKGEKGPTGRQRKVERVWHLLDPEDARKPTKTMLEQREFSASSKKDLVKQLKKHLEDESQFALPGHARLREARMREEARLPDEVETLLNVEHHRTAYPEGMSEGNTAVRGENAPLVNKLRKALISSTERRKVVGALKKTELRSLLKAADVKGISGTVPQLRAKANKYLGDLQREAPRKVKELEGLVEKPVVKGGKPQVSFGERAIQHLTARNFFGSFVVGGAGAAVFTADDEDRAVKASVAGWMIIALALAGVMGAGIRRFRARREIQYLNNNRSARKPAMRNTPKNRDVGDPAHGDTAHGERARDAVAGDGEYKPVTWWQELRDDAGESMRYLFEPLSRTLKAIAPTITKALRDHEFKVSKTIDGYMQRVEPFIMAMTKSIGRNAADADAFHLALINGDAGGLRSLMDKYNNKVKTYLWKRYKKKDQGAVAEYELMTLALDDVRTYARERGGIDVGYLERYFPRQIRDYKHFRAFMEDNEGWRPVRSAIDKEIKTWANKKYGGNVDSIPSDELAEIASKVLRSPEFTEGGMGGFKGRTIAEVPPNLLKAYVDPVTALRNYVTKAVNQTETMSFLGKAKPPPEIEAQVIDPTGAGVKDRGHFTDLGLRADLEESIGGYVMRELGSNHKDYEVVKRIIMARFNAVGPSHWVGMIKSAGYLGVLGNFGAAITQLGDLAYSIHFNGMGNTFKAIFDKTNRDWYKHFGLEAMDIDLQSSRDGVSKVLNKVLKWVGFTKLDKFGKNTVMQSTFHRMRNMARTKTGASKLMDELSPTHGKKGARQVIEDLNNGKFSEEVESVIWYKFLDLQPSALSEMPLGYVESGTLRIAYMMKSFTLKQFDVFREAGLSKINKARVLWGEGKKEESMKLAREGMRGVVGLATVFAAMNAGTSMIKDALYGRPTNMDELSVDTILRMFGASRYHVWRTRREGIFRTATEFFVPPTTSLDRAGKDMFSLLAGEAPTEFYRGIGIGDLYYWHYGGGREKVRKDIAKRYGIKLKHVRE